MKKRLLITSIVMMLVVAVALGTSTYAWFTSNATVTASSITMTAATNAASSIFIKWDGGTYGATISTTQSYDGTVLVPMVPNELTVGTTTIAQTGGATTNDIAFKTAGITTVGGVSTFVNVANANGVYFKSASGDTPANADTIFIKNTSAANVVGNVKIKATFTPEYIACATGELARAGYTYYERSGSEGNYTYTAMETQPTADEGVVTGKYKACVNLVRVAVFTRDLTAAGTNDTETRYILRGVLANQAADTYKGTIANEGNQTTFKTTAANKMTATDGATGFNICYDNGVAHSLATGGEVEIKILMWLDGEALDERTQGAIAKVAFTFEAVSA